MSSGLEDGIAPGRDAVLPAPHKFEKRLQTSPPAHRKPAIMQEPVLVLNATFEPINVTAVRRAMVLLLKGCGPSRGDQSRRGARHFAHHEGALGNPAASLPAYSATNTRTIAQEYFAARPQHLPVLWSRFPCRRTDPRSRGPALAWRPVFVGKPGGLLLPVQ